MNCSLYLMSESHFVDNSLGEQSKTGLVAESDTKGQVEGDVHHLHGRKQTLRKRPPPSSHSPQLSAKTKQILSFTLHVQPEGGSCYHT